MLRIGTCRRNRGSTSYLQFNLSGIPAGAMVSKATLRLYVDLVISNGTFDVYQVNKSWSESTLSYNNQPWYRQYFPTSSAPFGVAFDGTNIWVANNGSNNITKLRASDGVSLGTFPTAAFLVVWPSTGANVWVTNTGARSNSVTKF